MVAYQNYVLAEFTVTAGSFNGNRTESFIDFYLKVWSFQWIYGTKKLSPMLLTIFCHNFPCLNYNHLYNYCLQFPGLIVYTCLLF